MQWLVHRFAVVFGLLVGLTGLGGCTTASVLLGAAGVATDTSMAWEIVKHLHAQLTEGQPVPCHALDSVERALNPRCGEFVAGSVRAADLRSSKFGPCALAIAASDQRLWRALPEFVANGARPESCSQSPGVVLAQSIDCPDLSGTSPAVRDTLAEITRSDPRAIHHDVVRWLSCPASRTAGLDRVLDRWLADGALAPAALAFSPLAALHPSALGTPISDALEANGHMVSGALGGYVGQRPSGFELALRGSDWAALDWWFARRPELANRVPGPQLDWLPLARVIVPGYLADPRSRDAMVGFLIARGADPRTRLPSDPSQSVLTLARGARSPLVNVLEAAPPRVEAIRTVAANTSALRLMRP